jgi:hypothetical protein
MEDTRRFFGVWVRLGEGRRLHLASVEAARQGFTLCGVRWRGRAYGSIYHAGGCEGCFARADELVPGWSDGVARPRVVAGDELETN